jgi:hypothetical protein
LAAPCARRRLRTNVTRVAPQWSAPEIEAMLTLDECIGMSGLTDDEIAVVAEHQRIPQIVAAEMGHALLKTPRGVHALRGYICDLLEQAKLAGRRDKAKHLDRVLTRFNAVHPVKRVLKT